MTNLEELRDKVATGLGKVSAADVKDATGIHCQKTFVDAYHGSLDAAKALHEALLPGWDWLLNARSNYAHVWERKDVGDNSAEAQSVSGPARAWLLAILDALIAQERET